MYVSAWSAVISNLFALKVGPVADHDFLKKNNSGFEQTNTIRLNVLQ